MDGSLRRTINSFPPPLPPLFFFLLQQLPTLLLLPILHPLSSAPRPDLSSSSALQLARSDASPFDLVSPRPLHLPRRPPLRFPLSSIVSRQPFPIPTTPLIHLSQPQTRYTLSISQLRHASGQQSRRGRFISGKPCVRGSRRGLHPLRNLLPSNRSKKHAWASSFAWAPVRGSRLDCGPSHNRLSRHRSGSTEHFSSPSGAGRVDGSPSEPCPFSARRCAVRKP